MTAIIESQWKMTVKYKGQIHIKVWMTLVQWSVSPHTG